MNVELAECLDQIAAGKMWSESALKAAINKPFLSDAEKAVVLRYLNGTHNGLDHVTLQVIAMAIRNNIGELIMDNAAFDFIKVIAGTMTGEIKQLRAILDVLEDGETLAHLGVSDEDTLLVEEAHAMVSDWIKDGRTTLCEV